MAGGLHSGRSLGDLGVPRFRPGRLKVRLGGRYNTVRNWGLRRLVAAHGLSAIAEWAVTVGLLVHAFTWGGARAVGVASIAVLLPPFVGAPLVGTAMARWPAHQIRGVGLGVQATAYAGAAVAALVGAPTPVVAPFVVVGLATTTIMHPTGAALLPRIARSTGDLINANLWITYSDSASALIGSMAAGVVVSLGGPAALFVASAALAVFALAATLWRPDPLAVATRARSVTVPRRIVLSSLAELKDRPWGRGVLSVSTARNLVVGAFDVLLVIVALDALGLGQGGPGYLSAAVGAGAFASVFVTRFFVRRSRLRGALMIAISVAALLAVVLGLRPERLVVFIALPVMGICIASMDSLSRTLLQRSSDPRNLGPLMAAIGLVAGFAQLAGSVLAQLMLAIGGVEAALVGLGALLLALAFVSVRSLRVADGDGDLPAVEMTLLAGLPVFEALPTAGLEQVARLAETVHVAVGEAIMTEGEPGDACYVVADGEFAVESGGRVRVVGRGTTLGEVALLSRITRSATVTARTAGAVLRIGRDPFLVAMTGYDAGASAPGNDHDYEAARDRFRGAVAAHDRDPRSRTTDGAESWLGLGAAGRALGDPLFTEAVTRAATLAEAARDDVTLAQAATLTTWPGAFFFVAENPDQEKIELCRAALESLSRDDPLRVHVLAALASNLTFGSEPTERVGLIEEALKLAERHGDPALVGAVLNAEFICLWEPDTLDRREHIGTALAEIGRESGDAELEYLGGFFTAYCMAERGRLGAARDLLEGLQSILPRARNQYFEFLGERLMLSIDLARCEADLNARIDALAERHRATSADTEGTWAVQIGGLAYQAGTLGSMLSTIETMVDGPHTRTWSGALALSQFLAGDAGSARTTLSENADVERNYFWMAVMLVQAETASALGMLERCGALFDALSPYRGRVGITASGSLICGLVSRSLGDLALTLGRPEEAIDLLTEAADHADELGMIFESVISRRMLASALSSAGDHDGAAEVIAAALPRAEACGFAREQRLLRAVSR